MALYLHNCTEASINCGLHDCHVGGGDWSPRHGDQATGRLADPPAEGTQQHLCGHSLLGGHRTEEEAVQEPQHEYQSPYSGARLACAWRLRSGMLWGHHSPSPPLFGGKKSRILQPLGADQAGISTTKPTKHHPFPNLLCVSSHQHSRPNERSSAQ